MHCLKEDGIWHYEVGDEVLWRFHFNEEKVIGSDDYCSQNPNVVNVPPSLTGGTVVAWSGKSATNGSGLTDFALIKLHDAVEETGTFTPHFTGWDANQILPETGFGVHHPSGQHKKVAVQDDVLNMGCEQEGLTPYSSTNLSSFTFFQKDIPTTGLDDYKDHFAVTFDRGITKPGSSGSPFFNTTGHIVGHLHGGGDKSCCAEVGTSATYLEEGSASTTPLDEDCTVLFGETDLVKTYDNGNTERFDKYGRFWYSYDHCIHDVDGDGSISEMDIKQSSLKPWLDPNETTGGQLNGLTAFGCDLHMKDCGGSGDGSGDVAWEPNGQCDTGQGWQNIWESPDLWNCAASGDLVSAATDPQIDANNFIGFQVRNESNCTSQPALLRLYWTMASTGEVWPDDWVDDSFTVGSTTCELGNEITTQPISIPPITSGSSHTGWQAWNPVNYVSPTANSPYISPSLCGVEPEIPSEGEPPQYEVCFLARLYSLEDPITGELEGESILDNVLASNNIVTRNVFLVEPSIIPPSPTDTNNGHPSGILVNNNNLYSANLNINFSEISAITDQYQDNILVEMFLSNDLWTKWASTGRNGQGISVDEINKIVEINDFETAKLLNIPFNAKEFQPIAVKVTLLSGAGKQAPTAEAEDFVFRISHEVVSHTGSVAPKSPSSCIFKVEDIGGRLEKIASSPSLQLYPNPARDLIYLHYNVEAETNNDLQIAIYTMDGKLLEIVPTPTPTNSNQHLSIPIAHLTTGCYIVHIKDGDKQFSEKFVKIQ